VEQADANKTSMYLLAGGMALIIPTTVAVLSAKAYEPPADYTEDKGVSDQDQPVAEPAQPTGEPEPCQRPRAAEPNERSSGLPDTSGTGTRFPE
jgi:hypothetical protein